MKQRAACEEKQAQERAALTVMPGAHHLMQACMLDLQRWSSPALGHLTAELLAGSNTSIIMVAEKLRALKLPHCGECRA